MDINNPQHNYIKAINHFQKSSLLGNQNAKFYMAMAYLYQAMDILKQSAPLQNNPSPSVNNFSPQAPFFPQIVLHHIMLIQVLFLTSMHQSILWIQLIKQ